MTQNQPIRILQVVTAMNIGGLETMLMNYYRNIDRNKVQFDFLVHRFEEGHFEKEILELGGKIYRVLPLTINGFFAYNRSLKSFFLNHNYHKIVHVHNNAFGYFPIKAAKKANIPIRIIHSHVSMVNEFSVKVFVGNFLKLKFAKIATNFICCSQSAGEWLFGKNTNFIVLKNAIDSNKFKFDEQLDSQKRVELSCQNTINFINVGRFSASKNHFFLIEIFKEILLINSNSKLFLVGEGELKHQIEQKLKDFNLTDNVVFLGLRNDVNDILQAMDFFIFPSHYEGLPVSLIEAQAAGLKCITSTGVPLEVAIVPELVSFLSLEESAKHWAEFILNKFPYQKNDTDKIIANAGFNVIENVKWLQNYYIDLFNKQK